MLVHSNLVNLLINRVACNTNISLFESHYMYFEFNIQFHEVKEICLYIAVIFHNYEKNV